MKQEIIRVVIDKETNNVSVGIEPDNLIDVAMAWGLTADALKKLFIKHFISEQNMCKSRAIKEACNFLNFTFETFMNITDENDNLNDLNDYMQELERRKKIFYDLYLDSGDEVYMDKAKSCHKKIKELESER